MKRTIWLWNHDATRMFNDEGGRHYWFAEKLKERGYQVAIFCSNINHFTGSERALDSDYEIDYVNDIPFVFIKTASYSGNGIGRIRNWISFYLGLRKNSEMLTRELGRPDVILASSVHPLTIVAGIQTAKKMGIPCIGEVRDLWPEAIFTVGKAKEDSLLGKALKAGEYWIYKNVDALIFTKEGDVDYLKEQKWLKEQGGKIDIKKCHYINNGIDYDKFVEQIATMKIDDEDLNNDKFKVIYTGTIRKVNNVSNILLAAEILKKEEDIVFLIYGDGMLRVELEKMAEDRNLDNVKFKGFVNKQYIPFILSKSSINLLNYSQNLYNWKRGNSSNKLFEYLASGKPVISTVKMGYDIIERYNCGVSLEECSPQCLAESIIKIKNMDEVEYAKMGQNARDAAKQFDFKRLTSMLEGVIEEVDRK